METTQLQRVSALCKKRRHPLRVCELVLCSIIRYCKQTKLKDYAYTQNNYKFANGLAHAVRQGLHAAHLSWLLQSSPLILKSHTIIVPSRLRHHTGRAETVAEGSGQHWIMTSERLKSPHMPTIVV